MPARLRRSGIQRRLDICNAKELDPDITYRELQEKFLVSSRIVADALKAGRSVWELAIMQASPPPASAGRGDTSTAGLPAPPPAIRTPGQPSYLAMTIEPLAGRGDPAPYRYHVAGGDWQQAEHHGIDGLLGDLAKEGWELVYMARAGFGRGTAAFEGTYECILKRC
jgi:hypothetical protein